MGNKTMTQLVASLRTDLSDSGALWDTAELERAIARGISDLSRFVPREVVYEKTIVIAVTDEAWQTTDDLSEWVSLANKPIRFGTEVVKNNAGTTCVRDTDYTMDYSNGKILAISGGSISTTENCTISYSIDAVQIDLTALADFIRVEQVIYPAGKVPTCPVQTDIFGGVLTVTGLGESDEQADLTEFEHIAVRYSAQHTIPTSDTGSTYPNFLEDTMLLASAAYALFQYAVKMNHQAVVDVSNARTALTAAQGALTKVATYLENNTNEDSKTWLAKITTDIASLRTAINDSLSALNAYLDAVASDITAGDGVANSYLGTINYITGDTAPSVKKYLDDGDAFLNKVNEGGEQQLVPTAYAEYARAVREQLATPFERDREFKYGSATLRTNAGMIYAQEAAQRLSNLRSYIEQSEAYGRIAERFISEATQHLTDANLSLNAATQDVAVADKFRTDGENRRDEAWAIWRDRTQFIGDFSASSMKQMQS